MQAGADRDTAGVRGQKQPREKEEGLPRGVRSVRRAGASVGGRRSGRGEGDRQNPDGHALGRLEFICCTSLALVYKEKTQPNKNNWNNNYNSLKTLSTAFSHFFIF